MRRAAELEAIRAYAQRVADQAPPFTPAQRERIAALLHRRRRAAQPAH